MHPFAAILLVIVITACHSGGDDFLVSESNEPTQGACEGWIVWDDNFRAESPCDIRDATGDILRFTRAERALAAFGQVTSGIAVTNDGEVFETSSGAFIGYLAFGFDTRRECVLFLIDAFGSGIDVSPGPGGITFFSTGVRVPGCRP
ncbi:MAG: hypothetical protein RL885_33290 [Planctomycetota bacterium]